MSGSGDNTFHIKLGRIFASDGTGRFISLAGRVKRRANRISRSGGAKKRLSLGAQYFSRRVIVKVSLVKMGTRAKAVQALHLDYIGRDSAAIKNERGENEKGILYGPEEHIVDADAFTQRGSEDRHQFRIIVSPEDSRDMSNLTAYTRGLMAQMETDLGTKFDWVAANHYDTATPHTHIVLRGVRDDGKNLIIPREYISYGMRQRAEELVTLELGPMNTLEAGKKMAIQVTQERLTGLDRSLVRMANNNAVDISFAPKRGSEWTRRLDIARLKYLSRMGLVEKISMYRWKLNPNIEQTLRRMGERGDILKAYHRALKGAKIEQSGITNFIYDPQSLNAKPIVGKVIGAGVLDDVRDKAYLVVDTVQGNTVYVDIGSAENIIDISQGSTVQISPVISRPKPSDQTIVDVAAKRNDIYSPTAHQANDPSARSEFIEAHVRRLEAMRRAGHATRSADGSWELPKDYLKRAAEFEKSKSRNKPVVIHNITDEPIKKLAQVLGRTWLDTELARPSIEIADRGYGKDVKMALSLRRQYLAEQGILGGPNNRPNEQGLHELEKRDLKAAASTLSKSLGKPFTPMPASGKIQGTCREVVNRSSGKYAVIERAKDFTLVPWRDVLEQRIGQTISGQINNGHINWELGRQKGLGIN